MLLILILILLPALDLHLVKQQGADTVSGLVRQILKPEPRAKHHAGWGSRLGLKVVACASNIPLQFRMPSQSQSQFQSNELAPAA